MYTKKTNQKLSKNSSLQKLSKTFSKTFQKLSKNSPKTLFSPFLLKGKKKRWNN